MIDIAQTKKFLIPLESNVMKQSDSSFHFILFPLILSQSDNLRKLYVRFLYMYGSCFS